MEQIPEGSDTIREGERVTILLKGKKFTVTVKEGRVNLGSLSISGSNLIGQPYGIFPLAGMELIALPATTVDHMETMRRGPQIIMPDDASTIILLGSVTPGSFILEAGSGSGGLTIALASAVGPTGHVVSMDLKSSNIEIAKKNVRRAGFADRVTFFNGNVKDPEAISAAITSINASTGSSPMHFNSIILDMPDPWEAMDSVHSFLNIGGTLVGYLPTMNQVENLRSILEDWGGGNPRFTELLTRESLIREIAVRKGAVRPEYSMLGHTAYLTFARKYR